MTVLINQEIEVEVSDLKKSCSPEELGSIFSGIANNIEETRAISYKERRQLIRAIRDGLSENAMRMMCEIVALEFASSNTQQ